jgi:hypothetical protein
MGMLGTTALGPVLLPLVFGHAYRPSSGRS